jgi:hypothetical protein
LGVTTILSIGPGVAVMSAEAEAVLPLTDAVMEIVPVTVPTVTAVDAAPEASVVAVVGDTVPAPLTVKVTVAFDTAVPAASATTTLIVPADCPTTAELAGDAVIVTLEGGPTWGATASEPWHPEPNAANAAKAAVRRRVELVTGSARSRVGDCRESSG